MKPFPPCSAEHQAAIDELFASSKTRPILFSSEMVRAILDGRKTQTRRVVKLGLCPYHAQENGFLWTKNALGEWVRYENIYPCPYGQPGDHLWVKETFAESIAGCHSQGGLTYRADHAHPDGDGPTRIKWKPSIHMPRWASRITLEITDVRVERLQAISHDDALAEGMAWNGPGDSWNAPPVPQFAKLWNSINGIRSGRAWADNPWVWALTFKPVEEQ